MDWLQPIAVSKFLLFTLVLARVSGLVVTAPIFGSVEVPAQVRALLALALAVLIMPTQWHVLVADPGNLLNYLLLLSGELVIGLVLGLGVMILFSGAQLAGEAFGRISGLMLADLFDPSLGVSVPVFSRLLFLLALTIFVTIGGHRVVMAGLLDTFATIPPGSGLAPVSLYGTIEELVTLSFVLGLRAAAPVVTALVLGTLVLGLVSRTIPQLNLLAVGLGLNSMLAFAAIFLTLGATAMVFQDQLEPALQIVLKALHGT